MKVRCLAGALLLLTALDGAAAAATQKTVLILRGESPDLPGGTVLVDALESTIRKASPSPVDFFVEPFDVGRLAGGTYEDRLTALLAEKVRRRVSGSGDRYRSAGGAVRPARPGEPLSADAAPVRPDRLRHGQRHEHAAGYLGGVRAGRWSGHDPLRATRLPPARRVLVASGASRFDRSWERLVRDQLHGMEGTLRSPTTAARRSTSWRSASRSYRPTPSCCTCR